ncbi:NADH:ubiquinone oxidoreductase [Streptomyces sp. HNM0575]|uniref:NADH-quinone oxidoreductase subunit B family protein n=1 Tax=Streptomyces sp. HNM0575 TaxID=2716338 RepID=UPI00145E5957|nr:NADH:ubiquinone oxidoreductase [Streptomyces sp. HNM0575]NLU76675.1 NADH:ubiquinone oxidoreductase [Streptomyces sp. HNM0575]
MPWFWRGLRDGVVTTRYPERPDPYASDFPAAITVRSGAPPLSPQEAAGLCPTGAVTTDDDGNARLDRGRCILCGRCTKVRPDVFAEAPGTETAATSREALVVPQPYGDDAELAAVRQELAARTARFRRSLHIRHVDAGSDGSEEWEIAALLNPVYDIHRLGMFLTASPRHADVLLVTGAGARGMAAPLRRTYESTAQPVVVVAVGTDACSGGLHADSYATHCGVRNLVDVDIWVPGSPPSPFSLLHALLMATGRLLPDGEATG